MWLGGGPQYAAFNHIHGQGRKATGMSRMIRMMRTIRMTVGELPPRGRTACGTKIRPMRERKHRVKILIILIILVIILFAFEAYLPFLA